MKKQRLGLQGLLIFIVSFVMIIGSIITAVAESNHSSSPGESLSPSPTTIPFLEPTATLPPPVYTPVYPTSTTASSLPVPPVPTNTPFILPTNTLVPVSPSVECPPPKDWTPIFVQYGDSLEELAELYSITVAELKAANCLESNSIAPGSVLFVPPEVASPPGSDCGPPAGWIQYTVKKGDTLYSLGKAYGVTVADLQRANCLGSSTKIITGTKLWVPNVPTLTPVASKTPTKTAKPTKTLTPIGTKTATMTSTLSATATNTATATITFTATNTTTFTPNP